MVSLRRHPAQPQLSPRGAWRGVVQRHVRKAAIFGIEWTRPRVRGLLRPGPLRLGPLVSPGLMSPRLTAPKCEIVGIGGLPTGRLLRLDHLVGNALAFAIGYGLFLAIEAKGQLLLHVAGAGPAHQRLDHARLLGLVIELPFPGFGGPRLHRVFGGLEDPCGHCVLGLLRCDGRDATLRQTGGHGALGVFGLSGI